MQNFCKSLIRKSVLGVSSDTNKQIKQIFDEWWGLSAQLNEIESRKSRRSGFRAARVGGCSGCSKARWVAATYGAEPTMTDEQLAMITGYLSLDFVVLLLLRMLLLLLILLLLLLLLLISLVAIANHLLELSHNVGRDLLE